MPKPADRSVAIILIGIFKLLKSLLLICVSITAFHLVNRDLGDTFEHWAASLRIDPGNRFLRAAISHALNVSPKKLELVGTVTLVYAAMFGTEGVGLLMGKRWAEYMTVITTAGLLPLEIYEEFKRADGLKLATLAINIAAVIYLIIRLRTTSKGGDKTGEDGSAPPMPSLSASRPAGSADS